MDARSRRAGDRRRHVGDGALVTMAGDLTAELMAGRDRSCRGRATLGDGR